MQSRYVTVDDEPQVNDRFDHNDLGSGVVLSVSKQPTFYRVEALFNGGFRINTPWTAQFIRSAKPVDA